MLSVSRVQCDEYDDASGGNNYLFVQGQGKEEVGPLDGPALPARIGHNVRVGIVADIGSPYQGVRMRQTLASQTSYPS